MREVADDDLVSDFDGWDVDDGRVYVCHSMTWELREFVHKMSKCVYQIFYSTKKWMRASIKIHALKKPLLNHFLDKIRYATTFLNTTLRNRLAEG